MGLADRSKRSFLSEVRRDGQTCYRRDDIEVQHDSEHSATATIRSGRGREAVTTRINWGAADDGILIASCSCGTLEDSRLCAHIWSALLTFDDMRLTTDTGTGRLSIYRESNLTPAMNDVLTQILMKRKRDKDSEATGPSWLHFGSMSGVRGRSQQRSGRQPRPAPPPDPQWLTFINGVSRQDNPRPYEPRRPDSKPRELWYVLNVEDCLSHRAARVQLRYRELNKRGDKARFKKPRFDYGCDLNLIHPEDEELLRLLRGMQLEDGTHYYYREDMPGVASAFRVKRSAIPWLFPRLSATGRFVWVHDDSRPALEAIPVVWDDGPPWRFRLTADSDETQQSWRIKGRLDRDGESIALSSALIASTEGFVLLPDSLAQLDCGLASPWMLELRRSTSFEVPFSSRDAFLKAFYASGVVPEADFPPELAVETSLGEPRGKLTITKGNQWSTGLLANCHFLYGDQTVLSSSKSANFYDERARRVVLRDFRREQELVAQLREAGLKPPSSWSAVKADYEIRKSAVGDVAVKLTAMGWHVEAEGIRLRHARMGQLSVSSGVDWFGLHGNFDFDGISVSLPSLLEALRRNEKTITLEDGSQGVLPEKWLAQFASLIEMGEKDGEVLKFRRSQALLLDALIAENEQHATADEQFAEFRSRLARFEGVAPGEAPAGFQGVLRDYQKEGLGWLNFLREFRLGGCLADDMGLGKTVQVLAMLEGRRQRSAGDEPLLPSLAVVPKSLVFNWIEEAGRFTPSLRVLNFTGLDRKQRLKECEGYDLLITTYGTLRNDILDLKDRQFDYVILDESQAIKNHNSQSAKATRLLKADHRLALTGTPVENHLGELWSLFEFLNPGMLGRSGAFSAWIRNRGEQDEAGIAMLGRALRPFLLRRTKEQVLRELPEKTEQTIYCEMSEAERAKYDELRDYYRTNLSQRVEQVGLKKAKIHVLEALLRLRQAACHRGLLDKEMAGESSAKLDSLLEQVSEIVEEGHKALVFSQFTSLLSIVRAELDRREIVYEYLDGRTRDRGARVRRFQDDPACPLFLISLKAGGHGLNLTAADYVFILDPWWNPAAEAQAVDRAHRIGQQRPVFAYRLICRDTVEDKILELQKHKRQLADAIVSSDNSLIQQLSVEDLQLLLS